MAWGKRRGRAADSEIRNPAESRPREAENDIPFWRARSLAEMTRDQWESLCDGCGRCCLNKLEDWDTGAISWTNVACRLLDGESCRCRDYPNRLSTVPDCLQLDAETVPTLTWLPPSCAYRLIDEGRDLYWWHPLVSGDPQTVHEAGISVKGRTISEIGIPDEELDRHLADWPGKIPRATRRPARR